MRSRLGDVTIYGRNLGLIITRPGNKQFGLIIIYEKWNHRGWTAEWRGNYPGIL